MELRQKKFFKRSLGFGLRPIAHKSCGTNPGGKPPAPSGLRFVRRQRESLTNLLTNLLTNRRFVLFFVFVFVFVFVWVRRLLTSTNRRFVSRFVP